MLSINNNEIKNAGDFVYPSIHEDDVCYCFDTIDHLNFYEKKYYVHKNGSTKIYENGNEKYKNCPYSIIRQKLIDWMISVQDYHGSSEETLEMSIRIFDYIFFKDLFLDWREDSSIDNECTILNDKCSHIDHYANHYYDSGNHSSSLNCICGSYHDGILRIGELQLVILTAYFLACKYFERFPPKLSKLLKLTENAYSVNQLLKKEHEVLEILNFDLKIPLVTQYIDFYIQHETSFVIDRIMPICYFLKNLTYTAPNFLDKLASTLAAAIVILAKMVLCSFAAIDPKQMNTIYNEKLFLTENFFSTLNDLWLLFFHSLYDKEAFKTQKTKFNDKKYGCLFKQMEKIEIDIMTQHFFELSKRINKNLT